MSSVKFGPILWKKFVFPTIFASIILANSPGYQGRTQKLFVGGIAAKSNFLKVVFYFSLSAFIPLSFQCAFYVCCSWQQKTSKAHWEQNAKGDKRTAKKRCVMRRRRNVLEWSHTVRAKLSTAACWKRGMTLCLIQIPLLLNPLNPLWFHGGFTEFEPPELIQDSSCLKCGEHMLRLWGYRLIHSLWSRLGTFLFS